jgi:hypothetical protein
MWNDLNNCLELLGQAEIQFAELYSTKNGNSIEQTKLAEALSFIRSALVIMRTSENMDGVSEAKIQTE